MSTAAAISSSSEEDSNDGSSGAASAKSTLSVLKQLRARSIGFADYYVEVMKQIIGIKPSPGILDYPMKFILRLVVVIIGSIFLHDCPAEPMLPIPDCERRGWFVYSNPCSDCRLSLLKDGNTTLKKVKSLGMILMLIFGIGWFITGCVWVFSMPLPNMTHFPESVWSILPGLVKDMMLSFSSSSLPTDQLASLNSTMIDLISPEKHCAFPVYGLAVGFFFPLVESGGCIVMITVTAIVLFFLPSSPEVANASDEEKLQPSNV